MDYSCNVFGIVDDFFWRWFCDAELEQIKDSVC